jgi:hypothetical protein
VTVTNKLPTNILTPAEAQGLRRKLVEGAALSIPTCLELLSSHEHVRAHALAAKNRVRMLEAEVADLLMAVRRGKPPP